MTRNELVTNNNRNIKAIRREIVQAATNFYSERHDSEQDKVISTIKDMFTARSANDFVNAGVNIFVRDCFQKKLTIPFVMSHVNSGRLYQKMKHFQQEMILDVLCLYSSVYKLLLATFSTVHCVLGAFCTLSSRLMQTERIVSHRNLIVDDLRTSMTNEIKYAILKVCIKRGGTAHNDPRPAAVHFLSVKE